MLKQPPSLPPSCQCHLWPKCFLVQAQGGQLARAQSSTAEKPAAGAAPAESAAAPAAAEVRLAPLRQLCLLAHPQPAHTS